MGAIFFLFPRSCVEQCVAMPPNWKEAAVFALIAAAASAFGAWQQNKARR